MLALLIAVTALIVASIAISRPKKDPYSLTASSTSDKKSGGAQTLGDRLAKLEKSQRLYTDSLTKQQEGINDALRKIDNQHSYIERLNKRMDDLETKFKGGSGTLY